MLMQMPRSARISSSTTFWRVSRSVKTAAPTVPSLLAGDQPFDDDVVLMHASQFDVAHVHGMVFQADLHEFADLLGRPLAVDSLGRVDEDDVVVFQILRVALAVQRVGHGSSSLKSGRPRPRFVLPFGESA